MGDVLRPLWVSQAQHVEKKKRKEKIKTNKQTKILGGKRFRSSSLTKLKKQTRYFWIRHAKDFTTNLQASGFSVLFIDPYDVNQDSLGLWIPGGGFRILCKSKLKLKIPNVCGIPGSFSWISDYKAQDSKFRIYINVPDTDSVQLKFFLLCWIAVLVHLKPINGEQFVNGKSANKKTTLYLIEASWTNSWFPRDYIAKKAL